jgi:hypothetical protein
VIQQFIAIDVRLTQFSDQENVFLFGEPSSVRFFFASTSVVTNLASLRESQRPPDAG